MKSARDPLWIFGYGSLVWRPDFAFEERRAARLRGFARVFWQGSTDHRGVPGAPGRVVTLVERPGAECVGVAYRVAAEERARVLAALDHREQGGYARHEVAVDWLGGESKERGVRTLVYLATSENPNHLGPPDDLESAVHQIVASRGPSGENAEYVLRLDEAVRALGGDDPELRQLADAVRARLAARGDERERRMA